MISKGWLCRGLDWGEYHTEKRKAEMMMRRVRSRQLMSVQDLSSSFSLTVVMMELR